MGRAASRERTFQPILVVQLAGLPKFKNVGSAKSSMAQALRYYDQMKG